MKPFKKLLAGALFLAALIHAAAGQTPLSIAVTGTSAGPTPFICDVVLTVSQVSALKSISFTIQPKTGSVTRPLSAIYSINYLNGRGYVNTQTNQITVPVFGLYANYDNTVTLGYTLNGDAVLHDTIAIQTAPFNDPSSGQVYLNPTIAVPRSNSTMLSYDYIMIKNFATANTPIIIDSDGQVRWVGTAGIATPSATLFDNGIYISGGSMLPGTSGSTTLIRQEFDGTYATVQDYSDIGVVFTGHHNIDRGKYGMILDVNTVGDLESVNLEVDAAGTVLNMWNPVEIIRDAMIAGGDDPSAFVRPTDDWFHNNAVAYWPEDDSMILSSRENFVMCVDYETKAIKWILGDPTKAWYSYPSLRKYALTLMPGGVPPIGQHAVSMIGDDLLLFDDGQNSLNQTPAGAQLSYSAPRKYRIDRQHRTATEVWDFDNNQSIFSAICSSVYEDKTGSYLIDYAAEDSYHKLEILGLDPSGTTVFDYVYPCYLSFDYGWNAMPIHLEHLVFQ